MVERFASFMLQKYVGGYFSNFSKESFNLNVFRGEASMQNLVFNSSILAGVSMPVKLKFGLLGSLEVSVPSILHIASQGIKIKLSNIFLCLEMLPIN